MIYKNKNIPREPCYSVHARRDAKFCVSTGNPSIEFSRKTQK